MSRSSIIKFSGFISALAVLLNHINEPEVSIGIDGSLYEHHPRFHHHMTTLLQKLVPSTKVWYTENVKGKDTNLLLPQPLHSIHFNFYFFINF